MDNVTLNIYVRSRNKLINAHPFLADPDSRHKIFSGDLTSSELIASCIANTDAIFSVVGTNSNNPYNHLAENSARVIIDAMTTLRKSARAEHPCKVPTVVFVTSAGMTSDPNVRANFSSFLHLMLNRVGKYVYLDFKRAVALFQEPGNAWIPVVFICAPGLMLGPSQGPVSITTNIPKKAPIWITYTDLARAMILASEQHDKWTGKDVAVVGTKEPSIDYSVMMYYFVTGMMCTYAQPIWRVGYKRGWWGA